MSFASEPRPIRSMQRAALGRGLKESTRNNLSLGNAISEATEPRQTRWLRKRPCAGGTERKPFGKIEIETAAIRLRCSLSTERRQHRTTRMQPRPDKLPMLRRHCTADHTCRRASGAFQKCVYP